MESDPKFLETRITQLSQSIEFLFEERFIVPSLILLYSAIDILGWLARPTGNAKSGRRDFMSWVDTYLLSEANLDVTSLELYGARCGLLHSYSAFSELKEVRALLYHYGSGDFSRVSYETVKEGRAVVVRIEDLQAAFRRGTLRFLSEEEHTADRWKLICSRAANAFYYIPAKIGGT